jgi:hypothetical protein
MDMRRLLSLAATLLAVTALASAGASAAGAAPLGGLTVGFVPGQPAGSVAFGLDTAKAVHARLVRAEADWASLEPVAAGQADPAYLGQLDDLFAGVRSRGLKAVLVVQGSPCWASSAPADVLSRCGPGDDFREQEAHAYPPSDPERYGEVVAFLAKRYASALAAIEVWNEPDHRSEDYFKGPDKPERYAELLKAAYPRVKAAAPSVAVLAGSLVGADGAFLEALYAAGIKGSYDGLAVHYYDLVLASLRSIRQVQRAAGDTKPVWLTEFGWTSCYPAHKTQAGHACVTSAVEGTNLADAFRALRATSWVKAAIVYHQQDTSQYAFGILDRQGRRKPAFAALGAVLRRTGPPRAVQLRLGRRGSTVVASGSGPAGDDYELDVFRGGRLRYKAVLRLTRANTFSVRLPAQLGTGGLTVRVWQYWTKRSATRRT